MVYLLSGKILPGEFFHYYKLNPLVLSEFHLMHGGNGNISDDKGTLCFSKEIVNSEL